MKIEKEHHLHHERWKFSNPDLYVRFQGRDELMMPVSKANAKEPMQLAETK